MKHLKNKSKIKSLSYEKLEIQEYLTRLDVYEAKTVFNFRVGTDQFSENYRGSNPPVPCPLCAQHLDLQELSFICPIIKENELGLKLCQAQVLLRLRLKLGLGLRLRSRMGLRLRLRYNLDAI